MNITTRTSSDDAPNAALVAKFLLISCCAIYSLHALYAIYAQRYLYGDASWFLVHLMSDGAVTHFYDNFSTQFYYSRVTSYWVTQFPTVLALHLEVTSIKALSYILGVTYFSHALISLFLCYFLLEKSRKILIIFPLLGLFAGTINSDIYIVTEIHVATSFLWPIAIIFTRDFRFNKLSLAATTVAIVLAAFTYESWAFFAPILLITAIYRIKSGQVREQNRNVTYFLASILLIPFLINCAAILSPRDPTNKAGFVHGVLNILTAFTKEPSQWHIGALVSMASLAAIFYIIAFCELKDKTHRARFLTVILCIFLALAPPLHFLYTTSHADFTYSITDRGFSGLVMQVALLLAFLWTRYFAATFNTRKSIFLAAIVCALAIGQVSWQMLTTHAWAQAITTARRTLASATGPTACRNIDNNPKKSELIAPSEILCHWWVTPLSILLSPAGDVKSLLISDEQFKPFNALRGTALPDISKAIVRYDQYRKALNKAFEIAPGDELSFTTGSNATLLLIDGFSHPENWATWTDGKNSKMHICSPSLSGGGQLKMIFTLAPFLNERERPPSMKVAAGKRSLATWTFKQSDKFVQKGIVLSSSDLTNNDCVDLLFEFPTIPHSPLELGISSDPRHLGVAFITASVLKE